MDEVLKVYVNLKGCENLADVENRIFEAVGNGFDISFCGEELPHPEKLQSALINFQDNYISMEDIYGNECFYVNIASTSKEAMNLAKEYKTVKILMQQHDTTQPEADLLIKHLAKDNLTLDDVNLTVYNGYRELLEVEYPDFYKQMNDLYLGDFFDYKIWFENNYTPDFNGTYLVVDKIGIEKIYICEFI